METWNDSQRTDAVSYTHLDVYQRQAYKSSAVVPSLGVDIFTLSLFLFISVRAKIQSKDFIIAWGGIRNV